MKKKNFASQPANNLGYRVLPDGTNGISLTANDLSGQVTKSGDFFDLSNFIECSKCGTNCSCNDISDFRAIKVSADGSTLNAGGYDGAGYDSGGDGINWFSTGKDVLLGGVRYLTTQQQIEAAQEAQRLQGLQNVGRNLDIAKEKEQTNQIKAYVLPIAIGGAVIIIGIASYFIFKKKIKS